jgi:ribonuclease HII
VYYYERKYRRQGCTAVIGVDEAGRGPLAGPVVAAAVSLKTYRFKHRIDDSKKLSSRQREAAFEEILRKADCGIGIVNEKIIDEENILQATRRAMQEAVGQLIDKLNVSQRMRIQILVDGPINLSVKYPVTPLIKGDARSKSIAAASILAKVTRDRIMDLYHRLYPHYAFAQHKGYPTREHRRALKQFGPSLIHRKSFHCE